MRDAPVRMRGARRWIGEVEPATKTRSAAYGNFEVAEKGPVHLKGVKEHQTLWETFSSACERFRDQKFVGEQRLQKVIAPMHNLRDALEHNSQKGVAAHLCRVSSQR